MRSEVASNYFQAWILGFVVWLDFFYLERGRIIKLRNKLG